MKKLSIVLAAALLISGCSWLPWFKDKPEKPAIELASDGMDHYNDGDYKTAIESFQQLKDWYPFSKYAILAELKIADAHYQLEEYQDAIFAYEEFENLHPRNEAIPYVVYQIGRSYFDQIDTVDRDQGNAHEAMKTFNRLIRQFPQTYYANAAQSHVVDCLKSISGHDFYVGRFYYKSRHYKAALARFDSVVTKYPDVGVHYQALQYITRCEDRIAAEKAVVKAAEKAVVKAEEKPEVKPEAKPEAKEEVKAEAKPEEKTEENTEVKDGKSNSLFKW